MRDKKADIKATCIFHSNGKVLAKKITDSHTKRHFYRIFGGGVKFGETAYEAVAREIKEELRLDLKKYHLFSVLENTFLFEGEHHEQIEFVYLAESLPPGLFVGRNVPVYDEQDGAIGEWIPIKDVIDGNKVLYPEVNWSTL